MRARLLFLLIATGCAVSAATACSSPEPTAEAEAKKTTQASSVTVEMFDRSGNGLGSCSGTLVAKDLVLTAGHCAAGVAKWKIDARGADATAEAARAVTPWKKFGSSLSHPDHSDLALIVLSTPIVLDRYPSIATSKLADGAKTLRFSRASASATEAKSSSLTVTSARSKGFRLEYLAEVDAGGYLDTGGAVVDAKTGKIHGVVSGLGKTSGMLHVTRTDNFGKWLVRSASCGGATTVRGYPGSSGSSGSSGYGGGGDGWDDGEWGGYGGDGKKLDASAPSGGDGGGSTGPGGPGGPLADGGTSSGDDDTSDDGGSGGATSTSCPPTPTCEGGDCPGKNGPGTPGSTTPGDDDDGDGDGDNGGASSPSDEYCPGPPNCPEPDSQACSGPSCGGCGGVMGCIDSTIDYGSCASCGSSSSTGPGPIVR